MSPHCADVRRAGTCLPNSKYRIRRMGISSKLRLNARRTLNAGKETRMRARRHREQGKPPSTQAGECVREQIHHLPEGIPGGRSGHCDWSFQGEAGRRAAPTVRKNKGIKRSPQARERKEGIPPCVKSLLLRRAPLLAARDLTIDIETRGKPIERKVFANCKALQEKRLRCEANQSEHRGHRPLEACMGGQKRDSGRLELLEC